MNNNKININQIIGLMLITGTFMAPHGGFQSDLSNVAGTTEYDGKPTVHGPLHAAQPVAILRTTGPDPQLLAIHEGIDVLDQQKQDAQSFAIKSVEEIGRMLDELPPPRVRWRSIVASVSSSLSRLTLAEQKILGSAVAASKKMDRLRQNYFHRLTSEKIDKLLEIVLKRLGENIENSERQDISDLQSRLSDAKVKSSRAEAEAEARQKAEQEAMRRSLTQSADASVGLIKKELKKPRKHVNQKLVELKTILDKLSQIGSSYDIAEKFTTDEIDMLLNNPGLNWTHITTFGGIKAMIKKLEEDRFRQVIQTRINAILAEISSQPADTDHAAKLSEALSLYQAADGATEVTPAFYRLLARVQIALGNNALKSLSLSELEAIYGILSTNEFRINSLTDDESSENVDPNKYQYTHIYTLPISEAKTAEEIKQAVLDAITEKKSKILKETALRAKQLVTAPREKEMKDAQARQAKELEELSKAIHAKTQEPRVIKTTDDIQARGRSENRESGSKARALSVQAGFRQATIPASATVAPATVVAPQPEMPVDQTPANLLPSAAPTIFSHPRRPEREVLSVDGAIAKQRAELALKNLKEENEAAFRRSEEAKAAREARQNREEAVALAAAVRAGVYARLPVSPIPTIVSQDMVEQQVQGDKTSAEEQKAAHRARLAAARKMPVPAGDPQSFGPAPEVSEVVEIPAAQLPLDTLPITEAGQEALDEAAQNAYTAELAAQLWKEWDLRPLPKSSSDEEEGSPAGPVTPSADLATVVPPVFSGREESHSSERPDSEQELSDASAFDGTGSREMTFSRSSLSGLAPEELEATILQLTLNPRPDLGVAPDASPEVVIDQQRDLLADLEGERAALEAELIRVRAFLARERQESAHLRTLVFARDEQIAQLQAQLQAILGRAPAPMVVPGFRGVVLPAAMAGVGLAPVIAPAPVAPQTVAGLEGTVDRTPAGAAETKKVVDLTKVGKSSGKSPRGNVVERTKDQKVGYDVQSNPEVTVTQKSGQPAESKPKQSA